MFEKPYVFDHGSGYRVFVLAKDVDRLVKDLKDAGIDAKAEADSFGYEDLDDDAGHEELASVAVPSSAKLVMRRVLRSW